MEPRQFAPGPYLPSRLEPSNRRPLAPSGHLLDSLLTGVETPNALLASYGVKAM